MSRGIHPIPKEDWINLKDGVISLFVELVGALEVAARAIILFVLFMILIGGPFLGMFE